VADKTEEELILRAEAARIALRDAEKALEEYRLSICGVKVGDFVVGTSGRWKGMDGRVVLVRPGLYGKAWVTVVTRNADGQFGRRERCFYNDWEKVDAD
jgi:hypothetical protein